MKAVHSGQDVEVSSPKFFHFRHFTKKNNTRKFNTYKNNKIERYWKKDSWHPSAREEMEEEGEEGGRRRVRVRGSTSNRNDGFTLRFDCALDHLLRTSVIVTLFHNLHLARSIHAFLNGPPERLIQLDALSAFSIARRTSAPHQLGRLAYHHVQCSTAVPSNV